MKGGQDVTDWCVPLIFPFWAFASTVWQLLRAGLKCFSPAGGKRTELSEFHFRSVVPRMVGGSITPLAALCRAPGGGSWGLTPGWLPQSQGDTRGLEPH